MSIKKTLISFFFVFFLLMVSILFFVWMLYQNNEKLHIARENQYRSYLLADELRQSSDDLTRMARTYVMTGDVRYEKMYKDIIDIRNGKKPRPKNYHNIYWDFAIVDSILDSSTESPTALIDLMKKLGFTEDEFNKLRLAEQNSNDLVNTEFIAMKAVKGVMENKEDAKTLQSSKRLAESMMHDLNYHRNKANIMKPIYEFILMIEVRTRKEVDVYMNKQSEIIYCIVGLVGFIVLLFSISSFGLLNRLSFSKIMNLIDEVSKGSLDVRYESNKNDEFSKIGHAVNKMLDSQLSLNKSIFTVTMDVSQNAKNLQTASENVAAGSSQMSLQSEMIASSATEVNQNLQVVSSSIEEMSISISEVAKKASDAAVIAKDANNTAVVTEQVVKSLGNSAKEIGKVIDSITEIASQTNLLALNAAIEAAGAGDAGRGFAVVASEVKELARQAGTSSEEIKQKIKDIQVNTENTVQAISKITSIISRLNDISGSIASAVEQQSITSKEIAGNISQSSTAVNEVVKNINSISVASNSGAKEAASALQLSKNLQAISDKLNEFVRHTS